MTVSSAISANAVRRERVLAAIEKRLREIWPDDGPKVPLGVTNFNDLESVATTVGDAASCGIMAAGLSAALELDASERSERCPKCGRKLQWSCKPKTVVTIRGPVECERDYGYCRACRRGFFPR